MNFFIGDIDVSIAELKAWGELRGWIAYSILMVAATKCRDKEALMELLASETDSIIEHVRKHTAGGQS